MIKSDRIRIEPFEMKYLDQYYKEFNDEITKFQWPEPFESVEDARSQLQKFLDHMANGDMLFFSVLSNDNDFLGSVEVHWLPGYCPELGVWIKESEQNKGYAYEALNLVIDHLRSKYDKTEFYYEVDDRNAASLKLLRKFEGKYDIIEQGLENLINETGKYLELEGYILKVK